MLVLSGRPKLFLELGESRTEGVDVFAHLKHSKKFCERKYTTQIKYYVTNGEKGSVFIRRSKFPSGEIKLIRRAAYRSVVYVQVIDICPAEESEEGPSRKELYGRISTGPPPARCKENRTTNPTL